MSAIAYYRDYCIDLLSGEKTSLDFFSWITDNQNILLTSEVDQPRVTHLFYELSFYIEKKFQLLELDTLLVIDIKFQNINEQSLEEVEKINLDLIESPSYDDYQLAFKNGYEELLKGNCYQFNLTFPFRYSFSQKLTPLDFIFSLWKKVEVRGAYGSATYIPYFKKLYLSNSPECLFQYKKNIISTMPIKGTIRRTDGENWKPLWIKLKADKKNQAELYMISDLLRNDLSRIELPKAFVVKNKFPKLVPGLLHQYSQIDVELGNEVTLWRVIEKVFPGGSITGAPKVRAMTLINRLENRVRGFYCGSTLIQFKDMKSASINIRASVIDFTKSELLYQSGGGITLLSDSKEEYKEMTYKHDSFLMNLTL